MEPTNILFLFQISICDLNVHQPRKLRHPDLKVQINAFQYFLIYLYPRTVPYPMNHNHERVGCNDWLCACTIQSSFSGVKYKPVQQISLVSRPNFNTIRID